MIVPYEKLSSDTLRNLIEEFVTRNGTDTGYTRGTLEENIAQVTRLLQRREAFIVYDNQTNSCNIVHKNKHLSF